MIVLWMFHRVYRMISATSCNSNGSIRWIGEAWSCSSCANGESLKQLLSDPFLLHTSESQTNFDRLLSDIDGKQHEGSFAVAVHYWRESLDRETNSTNSNNDEMLVSAQSRLKSDFEVTGIIGRGGFGHVFKVSTSDHLQSLWMPTHKWV